MITILGSQNEKQEKEQKITKNFHLEKKWNHLIQMVKGIPNNDGGNICTGEGVVLFITATQLQSCL